jgi:hypothetical protein
VTPATVIASPKQVFTISRERLEISATCGSSVTSGVVNAVLRSRSNRPVRVPSAVLASQSRIVSSMSSSSQFISAAQDVFGTETIRAGPRPSAEPMGAAFCGNAFALNYQPIRLSDTWPAT